MPKGKENTNSTRNNNNTTTTNNGQNSTNTNSNDRRQERALNAERRVVTEIFDIKPMGDTNVQKIHWQR